MAQRRKHNLRLLLSDAEREYLIEIAGHFGLTKAATIRKLIREELARIDRKHADRRGPR